ncbi:MAG: ArsR/SmtB family transcription factor [Acidimicrobiia bacterium]
MPIARSRVSADHSVSLGAKLFRGLGDPTRLAILRMIAEAGEMRVTDLVGRIGGSQANVSGHVACLKDCGLVVDRPQGRQVFYSLSDPRVVEVLRAGEDLLALFGERVELCPNYVERDGGDR